MIGKENAEHYQWGEQCDGWYLVKRQDMSVIHERMPPRAATAPNWHKKTASSG